DEAGRRNSCAADGPLDARHSQTLRVCTQIARHEDGVEMKRVAHTRCLTQRIAVWEAELVRVGERCAGTEIFESQCVATRLCCLPAVIERTAVDRHSERTKGMPVGVAGLLPISKLDPRRVG